MKIYRSISHHVALILFWALTICALPAFAEPLLEVTVDRQTLSLGERLTLQVHVSTSADQPGRPQVTGPKMDDWQVVGRFESSSYDSRARQNTTQFQLQLQPVRVGQLQIGAFTLKSGKDQLQSEPITVTVTGDDSAPSKGDDNKQNPPTNLEGDDPIAFLEWDVEPKEAFIGQSLKAKLYAYVTTRLTLEQLDPGSFDFSGFWTVDQPTRGRNRSSTVQRGQALYTRTELAAYHLFPIRATTEDKPVTLPAIPATLQLREASFFSRGRPINVERTAAPIEIHVNNLPTDGRPSLFSGLPVGQVKLEASLDRKKTSIEDSVQLSVVTQINGLINNVPEITLPELDGFRVFPPSNDVQSGVEGDRVLGKRKQTWLLKPLKPGRLTIPQIELPYFNPQKGAYALAKTPKLTLEVTGEAKDVVETVKDKPVEISPSALALHGVRVNADLSSSDPRAYRAVWFIAVLAGSPLLLLVVVIGQRINSHRTASKGIRTAKGAASQTRKALQKLDCASPDAYAQISHLLSDYLSKRFGQSFNGLTHAKLRAALSAHNIDAHTIDALQNELDHCDFARFAPQSAGSHAASDARDRAQHLIAQIEEEAQ